MINPKLLALLGMVLVMISVFLPLATDETAGSTKSLSFWDLDDSNDLEADGNGIYLLAIALVAGLVVLVDRAEYVWVPVLLLLWYIVFQLPPIWMFNRNNMDLTPGAGWLLLGAGTWLLSAPLLWPMYFDAPEETPKSIPTATVSGIDFLLVLRWAGVILLVGGFFVPVARSDTQLLFYIPNMVNGSQFVQIALVLAGVALALRREGVLWVVGLIVLLVLGNDLRVVAHQMDLNVAGQLRWGWLLLLDGAAALIVTFFLSPDRQHVGDVIGAFFATGIDDDGENNISDDAHEDGPDHV